LYVNKHVCFYAKDQETVTIEQPGFGVVVVEFGKIATDKWISEVESSVMIRFS
jgi:hypothetical protein